MIASFSYIYILQSNVATQLTFGGLFNNHFIANCPQNVPVKQFWKLVNIWRRYRQSQTETFFGTQCSRWGDCSNAVHDATKLYAFEATRQTQTTQEHRSRVR